MPSRRPSIPKAIRDMVLNEFNHRCAMCGADRPQIHHIDGDPANNVPENLLPLCPNNHLLDSHNPTQPVDADKLRLLRQFKDPLVLSPAFDPLFRRTLFLLQLRDIPFNQDVIESQAEELVAFVRALAMGTFYADRLQQLLSYPPNPGVWTENSSELEIRQHRDRSILMFRGKLLSNRDAAVCLIVELLRYQPWTPT
jgi:hypothetical protein